MKGHVFKRGKTWTYIFDIEPDPLTGDRRQRSKGGWPTEDEAWSECRKAIVEYEKGTAVAPSKMTVEQFFSGFYHPTNPEVSKPPFTIYRNQENVGAIHHNAAKPHQK